MSEHDGAVAARTLQRLFTSGERLGWTYVGDTIRRRDFTEKKPREPDSVSHAAAYDTVEAATGLVVSGVLALLALGLWRASKSDSLVGTLATLGFWLAAPATVLAALSTVGDIRDTRRYREQMARDTADHRRAVRAWRARQKAHATAETERLARQPRWKPFRLDQATATGRPSEPLVIYGGSMPGWAALLSVYGAGTLASSERSPVVVLDLTNNQVSDELARLAVIAGVPVERQVLPDQATQSDLLAGLGRGELVDLLVEAIHGGEPYGGDRSARAITSDLLTTACSALGDDIRMGRIVEALRLVAKDRARPQLLSPDEVHHILTELLSDDYVRDAMRDLRRLLAFLAPLQDIGTHAAPQEVDAGLRCYVLRNHGASAQLELLVDLLVQRLIVGIASGQASCRTLVVVGADGLATRHIERLEDVCERQGVRLVLLVRHLRDTTRELLGAGTVGFMRLGHHAEAGEAVEFIGSEHRFVLSQLAVGTGSGTSETRGRSTSFTATEGTSFNRSRNTSTSLGRYTSAFAYGGGDSAGVFESIARTWGTSTSTTTQTSEQRSATVQRSREHRVEPDVLQSLPEHALLVVQHTRDGTRILPIESTPAVLAHDDRLLDADADTPGIIESAVLTDLATALQQLVVRRS